MVRMFIRHSVSDYKKWRAAYDAFDRERAGMGVTAHAVYGGVDNPNELTVTHDFADLKAAQAFAQSARLKEVMAEPGSKLKFKRAVAKTPLAKTPAAKRPVTKASAARKK